MLSQSFDRFFPAGFTRIDAIKLLESSELRDCLIKGAPFVDVDRAQKDNYIRGQAVRQKLFQLFQGSLYLCRTPNYRIPQKISIFQPNQLVAAEEWQGLDSLYGLVDSAYSLIRIFNGAIQQVDAKIACVLRSELLAQFVSPLLYGAFIGPHDGEKSGICTRLAICLPLICH